MKKIITFYILIGLFFIFASKIEAQESNDCNNAGLSTNFEIVNSTQPNTIIKNSSSSINVNFNNVPLGNYRIVLYSDNTKILSSNDFLNPDPLWCNQSIPPKCNADEIQSFNSATSGQLTIPYNNISQSADSSVHCSDYNCVVSVMLDYPGSGGWNDKSHCLLGSYYLTTPPPSCTITIDPNKQCVTTNNPVVTGTINSIIYENQPFTGTVCIGGSLGAVDIPLEIISGNPINFAFNLDSRVYDDNIEVKISKIPGSCGSLGLEQIFACKSQTVSVRGNCATYTPAPTSPPGANPTTAFKLCDNLSGDPQEFQNCTDCDRSQGIYTAIGCIPLTPSDFSVSIIRVIIILAIGIAFIMMVYGSFLCITSKGNSQQTQACQQTITSAVVGLLMIIFALVIVRILFGPAGIIPDIINIF